MTTAQLAKDWLTKAPLRELRKLKHRLNPNETIEQFLGLSEASAKTMKPWYLRSKRAQRRRTT